VRLWRGLTEIGADWAGGVVTIGYFDGVHRGHQRIVSRAVEIARSRGEPCVAVTFDPHPAEVIRPGTHPALLTTPSFKAELLARLGVDVLCVLPFDLPFSLITAESFDRDVIVGALRASAVVVGENFTYGHRALGNVELLRADGKALGFGVEAVRLLAEDSDVLSSTLIRHRIAEGDVETAARALGRDHRVEGVVVHGDARGRTIGYPTANLDTTPFAAIPGDGVYAGHAVRDEARFRAAISIGTNPTFDGTRRRVEAYLLDFDDDLYGEYLAFEFTTRLRPTLRFDSVDDLVVQMGRDVAATRTAT
jgi:riboflavin kinase / FMN adenylyltransferase